MEPIFEAVFAANSYGFRPGLGCKDALREVQSLLDGGCRSVRYADDMVILCRSAAEADRALGLVRQWMEGARLTLHPEKTRIADVTQPGARFDFLGYRFMRTAARARLIRTPRPKSVLKLREGLRSVTKRCNGYSLDEIIRRVNAPSLPLSDLYAAMDWLAARHLPEGAGSRGPSPRRRRPVHNFKLPRGLT